MSWVEIQQPHWAGEVLWGWKDSGTKKRKGSWIFDDHEATILVLNFFCVRAINLNLINLLFGFSATCNNLAWPKRMMAPSSHQERDQEKNELLRMCLWGCGGCWGGHRPDSRGQVLRTSLGKHGILNDEGGYNKAGTTLSTFLTGSNFCLPVTNHLKWPSSPPTSFLLLLGPRWLVLSSIWLNLKSNGDKTS